MDHPQGQPQGGPEAVRRRKLKMRAMKSFAWLAVVLLLGPANVLDAQGRATGNLHLIVKDPSGAVIPGATVLVTGGETATQGFVVPEALSDGQGVANAANLPVGHYAVTVSFPGFETRT